MNRRPVLHSMRVSSVARALTTETDWPEFARIAAEGAEVILSNTGDAGWTPSSDDSAADFRQGMSYPAKLTQMRLSRFRAGGRGIVVMPTELVARNGDKAALVRDEMADPAIRADVQGLYLDEVLPVFATTAQGDEARDYVATTIDRFVNPSLAHRLYDIAQNHAEKVRRRIGAFADWGGNLVLTTPQPRLRGVIAWTEAPA
ncbi:MAG TPA: hypothetical protein PLI43_17755 [Albidovulum sp.]|uniref:mannitol dehydrogenase family protein n=1 Tax=Albidovulum sp. TaxID=1872424 RepID=UPI002BD0D800|nr:hypothetical protein [Albidovulum sp.]